MDQLFVVTGGGGDLGFSCRGGHGWAGRLCSDPVPSRQFDDCCCQSAISIPHAHRSLLSTAVNMCYLSTLGADNIWHQLPLEWDSSALCPK